ncbi:hypothetical protein QC762_0115150 [Podospora pseudocomata]|uniref:C2H2-type domain-containing protein n=1 Tax=Podospora pseudocomata TaxID=2093779 RepID=A0ABR0G5E4_9PEZI|nr:hypothetical protein QC762_0115150 [Podospora pseudocomata]
MATHAERLDYLFNAPEEHLRDAVYALCNNDEVSYFYFYSYFLSTRTSTSGRPPAPAPVRAAAPAPKSRVKHDYLECVQCEASFFVSEHQANECRYHPGKLECDWEAGGWEDWDSDAGDPRDDERNKDLYLVGFKYTYCDKEDGRSGYMEAAVLRKMKRKRAHSDYQAPESNRYVRYRR